MRLPFFLSVCAGAALFASPAAAQDPSALFKLKCGVCHGDPNIEGSASRLGPHLEDLQGRKAGGTDFARYSPAMKGSDVVWNSENLDGFLANPRGVVRGTTMAFPGLKNPEERAAMVNYLLKPSR